MQRYRYSLTSKGMVQSLLGDYVLYQEAHESTMNLRLENRELREKLEEKERQLSLANERLDRMLGRILSKAEEANDRLIRTCHPTPFGGS